MTTILERLKMKRIPIDKWSTREQLFLSSAVSRGGDQNWMSVSRSLKPYAEPNRPPDWFSQKNCAAQYGLMLENVETPKRKKRTSGAEIGGDTPGQCIVRKLRQERKAELKKLMDEEKREYLKLKEEMELIKSGKLNEAQIAKMCEDIEKEELQKEKDALAHSQWLKLREERKLELERTFKHSGKPPLVVGQKRKTSDPDGTVLTESVVEDLSAPPQEPPKPALSPLLTSLLKTPSHTSVTSSILHNAITNQRDSSPTIASLLNSASPVPVSASLQQLVTTALTQDRESTPTDTIQPQTLVAEPSAKQQEEMSVESPQEIKTEVTEELTVEDSVVPDDKAEPELEIKQEKLDEEVPVESPRDEYTFDSDSNSKTDFPVEKEEEMAEPEVKEDSPERNVMIAVEDIKKEPVEPEKEFTPGSVEIVEVVVLEDEDSDKESMKKIVEMKNDIIETSKNHQIILGTETIYSKEIKTEVKPKNTSVYDEYDFDEKDKEEKHEDKSSMENIDIDMPENVRKSTFTPEYTEAFFDDMAIEVTKLDKSGRAKRDYSRIKKKEEKDLDILLAVEKVVSADLDDPDIEDTNSEKDSHDSDKKSDDKKLKDNTERSNSPWTEEEESSMKTRRRMSTPATPIDSVPNSPASSIAYCDDDRDYRTWKKSVLMLYSRLVTHKYTSLFLKPITDDQAPGYHSLIYRPLDLQSIRRNVETGIIRSTAEFQRDLMLMFTNAIMYNKTNDHVYNMTGQMQVDALQQLQLFVKVQMHEENSVRRETRTSESGLKRKRGQDELVRNKKRRDE